MKNAAYSLTSKKSGAGKLKTSDTTIEIFGGITSGTMKKKLNFRSKFFGEIWQAASFSLRRLKVVACQSEPKNLRNLQS